MFTRNSAFVLLIATTLLVSIACSSLQQDSQVPDMEIKIDGFADEWKDKYTYYEDKQALLAVANDDEYIYICLKTSNQELIKQIPRTGLTLWLDTEGGSDRTKGIKFPMGVGGMDRKKMKQMRDMDPEERKELVKQSLDEIEIIYDENKEKFHISMAKKEGIEVAMEFSRYELVYEAKIPINDKKSSLFPIIVDTLNPVSIGFETTDMQEMMQSRGGGRSSGGMGSGGGMSGGRGGGMSGGRGGGMSGGRGGGMGNRQEMPEQFKLWVDVKLK
jgi:hypothetical protein